MTAFALLFTLAAIGIAETAYLIRERKAENGVVCPIGGGCTIVLTSDYNRTLGIHNDVLGMLFYIAMCILTGLSVIEVGPVGLWMTLAALLVAGAGIMSLYFIYLQWRVIKHWCFWCLMSASTVGGMALIFLLDQFTSLQTL